MPALHPVALSLVLVLAGSSVSLSRPLVGQPRAQAYMHYSVGRLLEVTGALTEALVQYRRTDALDPDQCEVKSAMARVFLRIGRIEEARSNSARAAALCPENDDVRVSHAEVLLASDRGDSAAQFLRTRAQDADAPRAVVDLYARALLSQGMYEEGEAFLSVRSRVDSLDAAAAELHGRALLLMDDLEGAVTAYRRAVRLDPDSRAALGMLSRLLVSLERPEEGVPLLERLLDTYEGFESEYLTLAAGYSMMGETERAHAVLDSVESAFGLSEALLRARGAAYLNEERYGRAVDVYERLLELEPDSVVALNFIAYTLADEGQDLERAVEYAERAVSLDADNPLVRDTLGWTYFRLGRLGDARKELETALELGADDPVVLDHLGDVFLEMGDRTEACRWWTRALQLADDGTTIRSKIRSECGPAEDGAEENGG
jgi:tetratricopeptide (TPR) repeat protein